ncbi:MAG TPA: GNAT family N-acetyltransferase [Thermoplasmata archaeon]|nr:GNAT family N-acetyltransferase [Thermoplasmata archaeon]
MVEKLTTRRYRRTDRESCRRLWRDLTERHREIYSDPTIGGQDPEDCFDKHLKKVGEKNIWVAVIGGKVVGFLGIILDNEEAEMEPVVVHHSHRGKGVGSALVETAINESERLGVKYLSVRPVARNAEAIKFFRAKGFENIGHIELFMDFSDKRWKTGIEVHDLPFRY